MVRRRQAHLAGQQADAALPRHEGRLKVFIPGPVDDAADSEDRPVSVPVDGRVLFVGPRHGEVEDPLAGLVIKVEGRGDGGHVVVIVAVGSSLLVSCPVAVIGGFLLLLGTLEEGAQVVRIGMVRQCAHHAAQVKGTLLAGLITRVLVGGRRGRGRRTTGVAVSVTAGVDA